MYSMPLLRNHDSVLGSVARRSRETWESLRTASKVWPSVMNRMGVCPAACVDVALAGAASVGDAAVVADGAGAAFSVWLWRSPAVSACDEQAARVSAAA